MSTGNTPKASKADAPTAPNGIINESILPYANGVEKSLTVRAVLNGKGWALYDEMENLIGVATQPHQVAKQVRAWAAEQQPKQAGLRFED